MTAKKFSGDFASSTETTRLINNEEFRERKSYSNENNKCAELEKILRDTGNTQKAPLLGSYRLGISICCMVSMTINFATQASMSSAFVCMIKAGENNTGHSVQNSSSSNDEWHYDWDKTIQGWVMATFFFGYYISQLPSGMLTARFGPKNLVIIGLILESILQLFVVPASRLGLLWVYVDRFLAGLICGLLYAPTFALVGRWTPRFETGVLFAIAGIGMEMGGMTAYAIGTFACAMDFQGGWPIIFYTLVGISLITAAVFMIFVSDTPFNNKHISSSELNYIAKAIPSLEEKEDSRKVPMRAILTSMPVLAITVSQIGADWLNYMLITVSAMYLKDVIKLSDLEVSLLSALPFLAILPSIYFTGVFGDRLVAKGLLSNTMFRKISDTLCKLPPSAVLLGLCFLPEGQVAGAAVLNITSAMFIAFSYVSWMANPVDLAPAYSGFIVGVNEAGAIWVAIVVPLLINWITRNKLRSEWQLAFGITIGLQVVTNIFYWIFASGDLQPWALDTYEHSRKRTAEDDASQRTSEGIARNGSLAQSARKTPEKSPLKV